jgi:hypothetical protein
MVEIVKRSIVLRKPSDWVPWKRVTAVIRDCLYSYVAIQPHALPDCQARNSECDSRSDSVKE